MLSVYLALAAYLISFPSIASMGSWEEVGRSTVSQSRSVFLLSAFIIIFWCTCGLGYYLKKENLTILIISGCLPMDGFGKSIAYFLLLPSILPQNKVYGQIN